MSQNPFAAPESDLYQASSSLDATTSGQYREGRTLVHTLNAEFPDRCVKCNAPAQGYKLKRMLYWHHPGIYILVLFNLLIYAIVAVIARRKTTVHVGLCPQHREGRKKALIGGWVAFFSSLVLLSAAGFLGAAGFALGGLLCLGSLIFLIVAPRIVYATKIDEYYVRIAGAGEAYLARLPTFMSR